MTNGHAAPFGDERWWTLPQGWAPVAEDTYAVALAQAHRALSDSRAPERLARYYDPNGPYAGSTFLDIYPNPDFEIAASDLWALSTLSMDVPPLHGRQLIGPGHLAGHVRRGLRALSPTRPLTDIDAATATTMRELYDTIRTGLPPLGKNTETNQWVFASKLCARKRPELFPVRDSVVSKFLLDVTGPGPRRQRWGQFNVDIPIFAFVITTPSVRQHLDTLRETLRADAPHARLDWSDLRLLDVVLWAHAIAQGVEPLPATSDHPSIKTD